MYKQKGGVKMFQKGDYVMYHDMGVCLVEDVGIPVGTPLERKQKPYYRLQPVYGKGSIYIPTDTPLFMRAVMNRQEAEQFILSIPQIAVFEEQPDLKQKEAVYRHALETHSCTELTRILKSVYEKNLQLEEAGKKMGHNGQQFKKQAEALLYGELSIALQIPLEEVEGYICKKLNALLS